MTGVAIKYDFEGSKEEEARSSIGSIRGRSMICLPANSLSWPVAIRSTAW